MKKGSILFLKGSIIFIGFIALLLCIFFVPAMANSFVIEWPDIAKYKPFFYFIPYLSTIPFFVALSQGFKLLNLINTNTAFSTTSVKSIRKIKLSASLMSLIWLSGIPIIFLIAQADDAPGLVPFATIIGLLPMIIATFAAILEGLLNQVILIKSENDLTV